MDKKLFNKALDAMNEYMTVQGAYIFDSPTEEFSSMDQKYVYLANWSTTFGKYEKASGAFIPDKK